MKTLENKKIFVSGGAGVIGQELITKLHVLGAQVLVGDLKPKPKQFPISVQYIQGDLNYLTHEVLNEFSPEIFIHLAATFERSTETYSFWEENFWHNVRLSHHLATLTKDLNSVKKIINASSYLIYDPSLYSFNQAQKSPYSLKETDPIYPRNLTGMAKLAHEIELRFLQNFNENQKSYINARIYRGYGKGSRCVISRWIKALLNDEDITVYHKEGIFDYIYARDTAEGLIQLAAHPSASGIINLGTGQSRRVSDVVEVLKAHFPSLKYSEHDAEIPFEASQADVTLLKSLTNWQPIIRLEDAIPEIIEHERLNHEENLIQRNVILTSVSRKVSMIHAIKNAAQKSGQEIKLIGADANKNCLGKYFTDDFWEMPRLNSLNAPLLIDYCKQKNIRAIVPSRDQELPFFANIKAQLLSEGINIMISDSDTVNICLDKHLFYKKLQAKGFPVIPTFITSPEPSLSNRWVVKERFGAGSAGLAINVAYDEALSFATKLESPIFQPYISGKEYSVDTYATKSGKIKGIICRSRDLVVSGESQITTTLRHPQMEELVHNMLSTFTFYGHAIFQLIEDAEGQLHIIECNPRFGGASTLAIAAGLDSFYWFLLESQGENIDNYPFVRPTHEIKQIRAMSDTIISV